MGGICCKNKQKEETWTELGQPSRHHHSRSTDGAIGGKRLSGLQSGEVAVGGKRLTGQYPQSETERKFVRSRNQEQSLRTVGRERWTVQYPQSESLKKFKQKTEIKKYESSTEHFKRTMIENKKSSALVVAAIDFGTTNSGYAYSYIHSPEEILANSWGNASIKTPTVVLFDPMKRFKSFGEEAKRKYVELMKTKKHKNWYYFERFKMKLYVKETPLHMDMEIEDYLGKPMKAIDVFTASIRYIREHLLGVLNDPNRMDQLHMKNDTDIRWVLTVPAIWNDLSKMFMREAAKNAGIPDEMLLLALEPEAASLFCEKELGISKVPGCNYLVLDLGGGTADMTCHQVNEDGTLRELCPPTGGDFGGTTVDNAFIQVLVKLFGSDIMDEFKNNYTDEFWELMADFEIKKRKFDGSDRVALKFPVRMLELFETNVGMTIDKSLENSNMSGNVQFNHGKILLTKDQMKDIFDKSVFRIKDKTEELLNEVSDEINNILLVGGFSESSYLKKVMKEKFGNRVVLPEEPVGAVIKGAVIYGHESKAISSRKCRYTYGIARMIKFIPGEHPTDKKIQMGDFTFCDDAFYKHIEIGTEVSVNTPGKAEAHKYFPSSPDHKQTVLEVFKSKRRNPKFVDEAGCERVGWIKVDIDPKGDIWSTIFVKLIFGGTELKIEVEDKKNRRITTGSVDFLG